MEGPREPADVSDRHPLAGALDSPASDLYGAIAAVLERWLTVLVTRTAQHHVGDVPADLETAARVMAAAAAPRTLRRLHDLLATDVDEQRTNPLTVLRDAVAGPTAVLRSAGVPPPRRDDFDERAFPDDVYALGPATWRDVDDSLHEPGLMWGAWKAATVLRRRRSEGRR
jgi:hypothetical protein